MSIEIYVQYSADIKFVFHCILYFSHVKFVVWKRFSSHSKSYPRFITRIWLGMARKAFYIPYPRFILLDKTRIWLGMAREAFYIPSPRFILLDKTRIWLGMARKAFYIPHPRFILLDKTRIWLGMARKAFYIPYPRFILLDKTRIWLGKHVSQEFMISVRPSVRHSSVRPSATHPSFRPPLIRPSVSAFYPNPLKYMLTSSSKYGSKFILKSAGNTTHSSDVKKGINKWNKRESSNSTFNTFTIYSDKSR